MVPTRVGKDALRLGEDAQVQSHSGHPNGDASTRRSQSAPGGSWDATENCRGDLWLSGLVQAPLVGIQSGSTKSAEHPGSDNF